MLVDSRTLEPGGELSGEVGIIGGDAAGATLLAPAAAAGAQVPESH
jgi:hypothetical protein